MLGSAGLGALLVLISCCYAYGVVPGSPPQQEKVLSRRRDSRHSSRDRRGQPRGDRKCWKPFTNPQALPWTFHEQKQTGWHCCYPCLLTETQSYDRQNVKATQSWDVPGGVLCKCPTVHVAQNEAFTPNSNRSWAVTEYVQQQLRPNRA